MANTLTYKEQSVSIWVSKTEVKIILSSLSFDKTVIVVPDTLTQIKVEKRFVVIRSDFQTKRFSEQFLPTFCNS